MSPSGHSNPILDHASLQRADRASSQAIELINRILSWRNRGILTSNDVELTLLLLISKYFNALVSEGSDHRDVRERYEAFCQGLQITFEEALDAQPAPAPTERRCICRLSPSHSGHACCHV